MTSSTKSTLTIIFSVLAILVMLLLIWVFRCKLFNLASCAQQQADNLNKSNTPIPPGSPTSKWVAEHFDLTLGMVGPKIKALQSKLGIATDGKFGLQTKAAVIAAGYTVPLSQPNYNKIVGIVTPPSPPLQTKGIYAKYNNTIVRNKDFSQNRIAAKDEWLGLQTDVDATNTYYELDGTYYVIKSSSYIIG